MFVLCVRVYRAITKRLSVIHTARVASRVAIKREREEESKGIAVPTPVHNTHVRVHTLAGHCTRTRTRNERNEWHVLSDVCEQLEHSGTRSQTRTRGPTRVVSAEHRNWPHATPHRADAQSSGARRRVWSGSARSFSSPFSTLSASESEQGASCTSPERNCAGTAHCKRRAPRLALVAAAAGELPSASRIEHTQSTRRPAATCACPLSTRLHSEHSA